MRVALVVVLACLSACAAEKLALAPPPGVDLSGRWKLNEAESDDPQRLVLSQQAGPAAGGAGSQGSGGSGRGRGGRGGGGGGGGVPAAGGTGGPSLPSVGALSEGLRWPGKDLEIKQVAGVVAVTSGGIAEVYQPADTKSRHHRKPSGDGPPYGRDMPTGDRGDGPPPVCGWDARTLVVEFGNPDDDHPPFEQRYSVSADGQRLIEVIGFKGGRSAGFTVSRVWDRDAAGGSVTGAPPGSKNGAVSGAPRAASAQ